MFFIGILVLTAIAIASVAAYFSIVGLASIFTGLFWPVVIMGTVLEAGKLVAASFVYRYWADLKWTMKTYLISAVLVLMMITSTGIFGMLSSGYQKDSLPLKEIAAQVELLKQEKQELLDRKRQIDGIIAAISPNYITKRIEQQKTFAPETDRINHRVPEITAQIQELTSKKINQEVHTGPIVFVAKALGRDIDDATKYIVFLIMFAFDPLAVVLTIGANLAVVSRFGDKRKKKQVAPEEDDLPIVSIPSVWTNIDDVEPEMYIVDDDKFPPDDEDEIQERTVDEMTARHTEPVEDEVDEPDVSLNENKGQDDAARPSRKSIKHSDEPNPKVKTEKMLKSVIQEMNQKGDASSDMTRTHSALPHS